MFGYFVIIFIVIFFCYQVYSFYQEYKNDKNEIIQRVKKDLNVIYITYYKEKGMDNPSIPLDDLIIYEGDQSYTYNKKKIYLCLTDGNSNYEYDSIMFVAIHELAHVICDENGHTEKFWRINDELLEIAKNTKIYYGSQINRNYCPLYS
tara:strand:+ start:2318 stop:2764 length:447 start_codon:yes stop_codon:yes gene_type:complete